MKPALATALRWEDEEGNSGRLSVGDNYQIGTPLPFDSGLSVAFGSGRIFNEDTFTVRTRTSTIQPAQDSLIRWGATELGGGLPISNSTNELSEIIEGVNLTLVSSNEKPVTITIRGDVDQAVESVKSFVDNYNELMSTSAELSKFDKDSNEAGPLLGDSDLTNIRNQLSELLINPVSGRYFHIPAGVRPAAGAGTDWAPKQCAHGVGPDQQAHFDDFVFTNWRGHRRCDLLPAVHGVFRFPGDGSGRAIYI